MQPVIVHIQRQPNHSEHQNLPQIHSPTSGLGAFAQNRLLKHCKDLFADLGGDENPLQSCQRGRHLIARACWDFYKFYRHRSQLKLDIESFSHAEESNKIHYLLSANLFSLQPFLRPQTPSPKKIQTPLQHLDRARATLRTFRPDTT